MAKSRASTMDNLRDQNLDPVGFAPKVPDDCSSTPLAVAPLATMDDETEEEEAINTRCGYQSWRPESLQAFNKPPVLVACVACYSFILGFLVNGVNNVNLSTLERRFDLSSTYIGFIMSSYDISAAIVAVVIGFYGSGLQKSRLLAIAITISAVGSFVMTIPHFATDKYVLRSFKDGMCKSGSALNQTCSAYKGDSYLSSYFYVFLLAQLLHGIGGTTMFTVGISLIDDCVLPNKTPLYLGIVYGCNIFGAGVGYVIGGQFLNLYVDFDTVDSVHMTPDDRGWVGAWWLGPLFAAAIQCLPAIPLSMFGSELPVCKEVRKLRVCQAHITSSNHLSGKFGGLKFINSTFTLFKNLCYVFINLAMIMEAMCMTGLAAFLPKFVENQYGVTASEAAIWTGIAVIPAAVGGLVLGGWIADHWKLDIRQCIQLIMVMAIFSALASNILWIRCDQDKIYGVNMPYSDTPSYDVSLGDSCNHKCNCDTESFEPVCSNLTNELQYFSPCFAGCLTRNADGKEYSDCSCLKNPDMSTYGNMSIDLGTYTLSAENCRKPCDLLYVFIFLLLITLCLSFIPIAPGDSIQLRCVPDEYKTHAQGVKTFIVRVLGSFVGPLVVGKLLDLNCVTWREKCGETLSCWIYDQKMVTYCLYGFIVICKAFSFLFCLLAHTFYRPPVKPREASEERGACQEVMTQEQSTPIWEGRDEREEKTDV